MFIYMFYGRGEGKGIRNPWEKTSMESKQNRTSKLPKMKASLKLNKQTLPSSPRHCKTPILFSFKILKPWQFFSSKQVSNPAWGEGKKKKKTKQNNNTKTPHETTVCNFKMNKTFKYKTWPSIQMPFKGTAIMSHGLLGINL